MSRNRTTRTKWTEADDRDLLEFLYSELKSDDPSVCEIAKTCFGKRIWKRYVEKNPGCGREWSGIQSRFKRQIWNEKFYLAPITPTKFFAIVEATGTTIDAHAKKELERRFNCRLKLDPGGIFESFEFKKDDDADSQTAPWLIQSSSNFGSAEKHADLNIDTITGSPILKRSFQMPQQEAKNRSALKRSMNSPMEKVHFTKRLLLETKATATQPRRTPDTEAFNVTGFCLNREVPKSHSSGQSEPTTAIQANSQGSVSSLPTTPMQTQQEWNANNEASPSSTVPLTQSVPDKPSDEPLNMLRVNRIPRIRSPPIIQQQQQIRERRNSAAERSFSYLMEQLCELLSPSDAKALSAEMSRLCSSHDMLSIEEIDAAICKIKALFESADVDLTSLEANPEEASQPSKVELKRPALSISREWQTDVDRLIVFRSIVETVARLPKLHALQALKRAVEIEVLLNASLVKDDYSSAISNLIEALNNLYH